MMYEKLAKREREKNIVADVIKCTTAVSAGHGK